MLSDNERRVSVRLTFCSGQFVFEGAGCGLGDRGGFGSFLCAFSGVLGGWGAVVALGGGLVRGEDRSGFEAVSVSPLVFVGVFGGIEIPRPGWFDVGRWVSCAGCLTPLASSCGLLGLLRPLEKLSLAGVGGRWTVMARRASISASAFFRSFLYPVRESISQLLLRSAIVVSSYLARLAYT